MAKQVWAGRLPENVLHFSRAFEDHNRHAPDQVFLALNDRHPDLAIIDPQDAFCDPTTCRVHKNGVPLYADGNHLSLPGVALLIDLILPYLDPE